MALTRKKIGTFQGKIVKCFPSVLMKMMGKFAYNKERTNRFTPW